MELKAEINIAAHPTDVWQVVADIDRAAEIISAIEQIEILERPTSGLTGLKWRETRVMFGKRAQETMWITDAQAPLYYRARAESHGAVYTTEVRLVEASGSTTLQMTFRAEPRTLGARLMWALTGWLFERGTRKALDGDLRDIKAAVEARTPRPAEASEGAHAPA